jgi:hypothetical protein
LGTEKGCISGPSYLTKLSGGPCSFSPLLYDENVTVSSISVSVLSNYPDALLFGVGYIKNDKVYRTNLLSIDSGGTARGEGLISSVVAEDLSSKEDINYAYGDVSNLIRTYFLRVDSVLLSGVNYHFFVRHVDSDRNPSDPGVQISCSVLLNLSSGGRGSDSYEESKINSFVSGSKDETFDSIVADALSIDSITSSSIITTGMKTSNQVIPNASNTPIPFDTRTMGDYASYTSPAFTLDAGIYVVSFVATFITSGAHAVPSNVLAWIDQSGSRICNNRQWIHSTASSVYQITGATLVTVSSSDTISLWTYQNTTDNVTANGATYTNDRCRISIFKVYSI